MRRHPISWWKTKLGHNEIKKIGQSILAGHTTQGPAVKELECRLAGLLDVPYAVLTMNGSSALLMALLAAGVKAGDEVILPNLTFVATALAPQLLGVRIRLVDVIPCRPLIDPVQVKKAITKKTKAIIPVHLNGRAADIEALNALGKKYGITVIEDAAQALCSRNASGYLGTQADMGIFSLAITKLITTVQGGLVVTRKKELFDRLKTIRDYGTTGFNFKFNDILASVGLSQIERIQEKIRTVQEVHASYKAGLADVPYITMIDMRTEEGELPLWTEVLCEKRERVTSLLTRKNIQAKPFDRALCDVLPLGKKRCFPRCEPYVRSGLILPSGPDQSKDDIYFVIRSLREIRDKM